MSHRVTLAGTFIFLIDRCHFYTPVGYYDPTGGEVAKRMEKELIASLASAKHDTKVEAEAYRGESAEQEEKEKVAYHSTVEALKHHMKLRSIFSYESEHFLFVCAIPAKYVFTDTGMKEDIGIDSYEVSNTNQLKADIRVIAGVLEGHFGKETEKWNGDLGQGWVKDLKKLLRKTVESM